MKISTAFAKYIREYLLIRGVSPNTVGHYRHTGEAFCRLVGDLEIEDITLGVISDFERELRAERKRCQNTIREYLLNLKMVLKYWDVRGAEVVNCELIPIPKRKSVVPVFLSAEEVERMIECAYDKRAKFVVSFLYGSGCRLSEMLQLNRGQIVDRQFTVIGKNDKPRLCFIDSRTERLMTEYLDWRKDGCEALFVTKKTKTRMTATNVQLLVKNAAERAGIRKHVTPHTLRHSFATNYLENDGNIRYLATLLGHASLNTTAHYAHVVDNQLRKHYQLSHTF